VALSKQRPYAGDTADEIMAQLLTGSTRPLAHVRRGIDPGLASIIDTGMAADRTARFGSARAMADALGAWLRARGQPLAGMAGTSGAGALVSPTMSTAQAAVSPTAATAPGPAPPATASAAGSELSTRSAMAAAPERSAAMPVMMTMTGCGLLLLGGIAALGFAFYNSPAWDKLMRDERVAAAPSTAAPSTAAPSTAASSSAASSSAASSSAEPGATGAPSTAAAAASAAAPRTSSAAPGAEAPPPAAPHSPDSPAPPAPRPPPTTPAPPPTVQCKVERDCNTFETCQAGRCVCEKPYTRCGNECVVLFRNHEHCGSCGNACGPSASCNGGKCQTCTGHGRRLCGTDCAFVIGDNKHCGRCNNRCIPPRLCRQGNCLTHEEWVDRQHHR
jgi:hypothetical protein